MQSMLLTRTWLIAFCLASAVALATPNTGSAEDGVDFARDIQPLLRMHCYRCHGPNEREGGVRLDLRKAAFGEGDSGEPLIVPRRPEESLLWRRLSDPEYGELMPMDGQPLGDEEIATIVPLGQLGTRFHHAIGQAGVMIDFLHILTLVEHIDELFKQRYVIG